MGSLLLLIGIALFSFGCSFEDIWRRWDMIANPCICLDAQKNGRTGGFDGHRES